MKEILSDLHPEASSPSKVLTFRMLLDRGSDVHLMGLCLCTDALSATDLLHTNDLGVPL